MLLLRVLLLTSSLSAPQVMGGREADLAVLQVVVDDASPPHSPLCARCLKQIWKVGKEGKVGKVGKVGREGVKVGREGR
jgi:hypothetical protein